MTGITAEQLIEIMPHCPREHAEEYADALNKTMLAGGITTVLRVAALLGQGAEESEDLRGIVEYASGKEYEGRTDLGNTHPGDGVRYKGRGMIQITGRNNYTAMGIKLGLPLVEHPELLEQPEHGFRASVQFWVDHGLNDYADKMDFMAIGKAINRGDPHSRYQPNGWEMRLEKTHLALAVLGRGAIIIGGTT